MALIFKYNFLAKYVNSRYLEPELTWNYGTKKAWSWKKVREVRQ